MTVVTSTGVDELRRLHRAGELVGNYALVPRLLVGLDADDLVRAGNILSRLDPDNVVRAHPTARAMTVAITGHGTLSALVPALTAELARHGLVLRPRLSEFDAYVFDLSDPDSRLYALDAELVLCLLDPMVVFDEVPVPWGPDDVARVLEEKLVLVESLVRRFERVGRGTLVLNTLPLPRTFTAQLLDHRSRARLGVVWREAGIRLLRLAEEHPSLVVLDLDPVLAEGTPATDARQSVYARAHLAPGLLGAYAREVGHLARHLTGRTKKVLALDLDGTLWGGLVGEDGVDGIHVGDGYRGAAYSAFQRVVKQIGSQGVLLAAVSKNDMQPVREALSEHPRMVLRENDLVRVIANWRPKSDNLAELASALNLNVDSFVFIDDSPYECGLVGSALPGVTVLRVDGEDPAGHVGRLLRDGWFDTRELTSEDRTRIAKYRDEMIRYDFLQTFDTLEDYLRELGVRVRLCPVEERDMARVAQITLRTNQFNLTARRLQRPDVLGLAADPASSVLAIHSSDRFGDNGLVGAVFTRREDEAVHIDNFLLSCRVFSRGIEQACLAAILRRARADGARAVIGSYRQTPKNGVVKDFYVRYGFELVVDDGTTATFRHDLTTITEPPMYVHLTESPEAAPSGHPR